MAARIDEEQRPKARNDAYTGMLLLSLLILIGSCALIYLDYSQYPTSKPQAPPKTTLLANPLEGGGAPPAGQPKK